MAALAGLGESSVYAALGSVLCLLAFILSVKKSWFFTGPWRVASAVFVLVLSASQIVSVSLSTVASSTVLISGIVNGAIFILFLGVLLSAAKEISKKPHEEEEEEEKKKEAKKLTYQI